MLDNKYNENPMSFLPEDYIRQKIEHRANIFCVSLFAVVFVAVVGAFAVTFQERSEALLAENGINQAMADAAKRIDRLEALKRQRDRALLRARFAASLVEPIPRTHLLAELIKRMPADLSVLELDLQSRTVQPPKPRPSKAAMGKKKKKKKGQSNDEKAEEPGPPQIVVKLSVTGLAATDVQVAQYMAMLGRSELFSDVDLVFSEEAAVRNVVMRKFRIDMTLSGRMAHAFEDTSGGVAPARVSAVGSVGAEAGGGKG